jgi:hypothetical protein
MPRIDIATVPARKGSGYPPPFDCACATRTRKRLGDAGGLTDFGVNLMTLPPGGWSSQRHWHSHEDEFVYVLEGELVLVENEGETRVASRRLRRVSEEQRQRPSPGQSIGGDGRLSRGGIPPSRRISPPVPTSICRAPTRTGVSSTRTARLSRRVVGPADGPYAALHDPAGLEQGLEIAEDPVEIRPPPARWKSVRVARRPSSVRRWRSCVMVSPPEARAWPRDFEGQAREAFGHVLFVEQPAIGLHQLERQVSLRGLHTSMITSGSP